MVNFDDVVDRYFPPIHGRWHVCFLISVIICINQPFVYFGRLGFLLPNHYCSPPVNVPSHWSSEQVVNFSIPFKDNPQDPPQIGQPFEPCREYAMDSLWSHIKSNTSFYETMANRSAMYTNLTTRECSNGVKFIPSSILRLSIGQDFKAVCNHRYYASFANSFYMLGMFFGFFLAGPLSDNFGRRPVLLWTVLISYIIGALTSTSVNIWMFSVIRLILGTIMNIGFVTGCVMISECVGKDGRNSVLVLRRIHGISVAQPMLVLLFYLIQNWRWTHVAFCYPIIAGMIGFFCWTESPRWLVSKGRVDEAYDAIMTILSRSGRNLSEEETAQLKSDLQAITKGTEYNEQQGEIDEAMELKEKSDASANQSPGIGFKGNKNRVIAEWRRITFLFRNRVLRKNFLIVIVIFFLQAFLFYGAKFYSVRLKGNPYVIALLTGVIGLPGVLFQWLVYKLFDRKWPMVGFYVCAVIFLAVAFCLKCAGFQGVPIIGVTTAAIFFVDGVFGMLYVRIPEMFPSVYRATALGVSGSIARLASVAAVYVERLDEMVWPPLPLLIFTIATALALITSIFMPPGRGEMIDFICDDDE